MVSLFTLTIADINDRFLPPKHVSLSTAYLFQQSTGSWKTLADMKMGQDYLACGITINGAGEKVSTLLFRCLDSLLPKGVIQKRFNYTLQKLML
jgi:hypothetical protein